MNTQFRIQRFSVTITQIFVLVMLFLYYPIYALGSKEVNDEEIDAVESLLNDPLLQKSIVRAEESKKKPPLDYLDKITKAKQAIVARDFLKSLLYYADLQNIYGDNPEVLFGIAESYYLLGDVENAQPFFQALLMPADDDSGGFIQEEILSRYRLADIYYQQESLEKFISQLQYIISTSPETDFSILSILKTQSLDYVISLFEMNLDYSYIAQRELGVFYAFQNQVSDESVTYLLTSLAMASHRFTPYLQTQQVGYRFNDLLYMIELLKDTVQGREYIRSFNITRMLVALRKFYYEQDIPNMTFLGDYCTELLAMLSFMETEDSNSIYLYYPVLR